MATSLCTHVPALFLLLLLLVSAPCNAGILRTCKFDAIYQLGDSISDTGNLIREHPFSPFARLPYGGTFFKHATGRCSNGLLIIDFLGNFLICFFLLFVVLIQYMKQPQYFEIYAMQVHSIQYLFFMVKIAELTCFFYKLQQRETN